jgi:hypothetical protein
MNDRSPVRALVLVLLLALGAAAVGVTAFNAGVQRGLVDAGRTAVLPEAASRVYVMTGPWHGGVFPVVPLVIGFVVVAFLLRAFAWRGRGGCGPYRGHGVPPAFDEWHRRAHDRMAGGSTAGTDRPA